MQFQGFSQFYLTLCSERFKSYQFSKKVLWIQLPEALQILGLAIQNRQFKIQN